MMIIVLLHGPGSFITYNIWQTSNLHGLIHKKIVDKKIYDHFVCDTDWVTY